MHKHTKLKKVTTGVYQRAEGAATVHDQLKRLNPYNYTCIRRRFPELVRTEFHTVAAMGGLPGLACTLNAPEITVYDPDAAKLKKLHKAFLEIIPSGAKIKYEKKQLTHPNFTPNAEVAVLENVLQKVTAERAKRLLENLEVRKVLVYGPNMETAVSDRWVHYRDGANITFTTIKAMCKLVTDAGYTVKIAQSHNDEMLVFAEK
jgi:hypothetical protein